MVKNNMNKTGVKWGLLLKTLFLSPEALRIGLANDGGHKRFVVACCDSQKDGIPVFWGDSIPLWLRLIVPIIVATDTYDLPVYMLNEEIGDGDPDEWIDRNEERCLPSGFTAEKIVIDYAVNNGRIVAMSAVAESRDEYLENVERTSEVSMINAPLQGAAQLLGSEEKKKCIIWKLSKNGSIFSRVEDGVVTDTCTFWIGCTNVIDNTADVHEQAGQLINSIAGEWNEFPVVLLTQESVTGLQEGTNLGNGVIRLCSKMNLLPTPYREAFGNAVTPDRYVQHLPFHKKQNTRKLHFGWCKCIASIRIVFILLLISLGIIGSYIGTTRIMLNRDSASMEKIKKEHNEVREASALRDALLKKLEKQTAFVSGESRITTLLNDLQTAVPEGAGLEELNVAELTEDTWHVQLHVRAQSSSVMQPFLNRIGTIDGMSNVRMVYSERGEDRSGKRMLLFKVEGEWK